MSKRFGNSISRRESLRRAGLLSLGTGIPFSFVACAEQGPAAWAMANVDPIQAPGYGTDPNLIHPVPAPWPKTLTEAQLKTLAALADLIVPREGDLPAATEAGVVEVLDEWVSAPYPDQQTHRVLLLSGLDWCDRESQRRVTKPYADASVEAQRAIIEDIARQDTAAELEGPRQFFEGLRILVTGAYYTSPAGVRELGFQGNTPISGEYPGPSEEATAHLKEQLDRLGLDLPTNLQPTNVANTSSDSRSERSEFTGTESSV